MLLRWRTWERRLGWQSGWACADPSSATAGDWLSATARPARSNNGGEEGACQSASGRRRQTALCAAELRRCKTGDSTEQIALIRWSGPGGIPLLHKRICSYGDFLYGFAPWQHETLGRDRLGACCTVFTQPYSYDEVSLSAGGGWNCYWRTVHANWKGKLALTAYMHY